MKYKIGHTTYVVKTTFNPAFRESLSDILKRLITRDCENLLGDTEQEQGNQCKF
ncbi:MAG: transposon-encoded TnpW family protein [Lachnospiraceae bacterium]|nr:transposon-encoded TnpW family protein [Lachnospiraceae bacterium]